MKRYILATPWQQVYSIHHLPSLELLTRCTRVSVILFQCSGQQRRLHLSISVPSSLQLWCGQSGIASAQVGTRGVEAPVEQFSLQRDSNPGSRNILHTLSSLYVSEEVKLITGLRPSTGNQPFFLLWTDLPRLHISLLCPSYLQTSKQLKWWGFTLYVCMQFLWTSYLIGDHNSSFGSASDFVRLSTPQWSSPQQSPIQWAVWAGQPGIRIFLALCHCPNPTIWRHHLLWVKYALNSLTCWRPVSLMVSPGYPPLMFYKQEAEIDIISVQ